MGQENDESDSDDYEEDEDEAADEDEDEDEEEEEESDESQTEEEDQDAELLPADEDIEAQDNDKPRSESRKGLQLALLLCCCCCLLLIGGALAGYFLYFEEVINEEKEKPPPPTPAPVTPPPQPIGAAPTLVIPTKPPVTPLPTAKPTTSAPTPAPVVVPTPKPTPFPTASPSVSFNPTEQYPEEVVMPPDADTFIFVDGFYKAESQGSIDTMLVQNGLITKTEIPDAFILMTFDLSCCGMPASNRIQNLDKSAILKLHHVPSTLTRGAATYNIVRLGYTPLSVENLHGDSYVLQTGIDGPSFQVKPSDTTVTVDVTDLVFSDFPLEKDQLYLQIENRGEEQEAGDRFYSRESANPPQLIIGLPHGGPRPTNHPTISPAPSLSNRPTGKPMSSTSPSAMATSIPTLVLVDSTGDN